MELLVVIAIILMLSGIIGVRLNLALKQDKLENDIKKLASNIKLAQQYALGQREGYRYYGIVFYDRGYRIRPYDNPGEPPLVPVVVPSSINESGDIPFSKGITAFKRQDFVFDFMGSIYSSSNIEIELTANSSKKTLTVTHLTGHITIN